MTSQSAVKNCFNEIAGIGGLSLHFKYLPVFFSCGIVLLVMLIMYTIVSSLDSGLYNFVLYFIIPFLLVAYGICTVSVQGSFHDIGFTSWIVFLFFIVFFCADFFIGKGMFHDDQLDVIIGVYALMALVLGRIILIALPGAKGANQYGKDPLAHADGAQYNDGRRDNNQPNTITATIDQLQRLDFLRTSACAMTKSRLVALSVLFLLLFVVYLFASNRESISSEAKEDQQAKEETKAIGLPIKVTGNLGPTYYEGKIQNIAMS